MKEIVEIYNNKIKEIRYTNRYMQNYIDSCHKEPEIRAVYPEQNSVHSENFTNITVDSDSLITQEKHNGSEK